MGAFTSKTEEDLKVYLERDYDITHYPRITQINTKKQAIVHQITTDSTQQANRIRSDVNVYKHLQCKSISSILQYIPLESTKICSDQQYHYIIEEDMQKYNLKEEFFARKYYKQKFADNQILAVLKTFLCGLNVYHAQFQRKFHNLIKLDSITVDENHSNHLRLTDPLFISQSNFFDNDSVTQSEDSRAKQNPTETFLKEDLNSIRQPPERLQMKKTKFNQMRIELNELLADIYTVGIIGLELNRMQLFQKIDKPNLIPSEIASVNNLELRNIISLLTSLNPEERSKVYEILKVSAHDFYCLEKSLRKGHLNKNPTQTTNLNTFNQSPLHQNNNHISMKKQNHFSFGVTSTNAKPVFASVNKSAESTLQNSDLHLSLPFKPSEKPVKQSFSNMSTDRTFIPPFIPPRMIVQSGSLSTQKPVIKFSSSSNLLTNAPAPVLPNNQKSFSIQTSQIVTKNVMIKDERSLVESVIEQEKTRSKSFILNDEKKSLLDRSPLNTQTNLSPFKNQMDISPLKNQMDLSPLSLKEYPSEDSNYKKIFEKFSHLNYEAEKSPSIFLSNKDKTLEDMKMEEEMQRLLKESNKKAAEPSNGHINTLTPIQGNDTKIDSPTNDISYNKAKEYEEKQNPTDQASPDQKNQDLPVYRPNKQVQQILKRLGIGSLLYGNKDQNKQQQSPTKVKPEEELTLKNQQTTESLDNDTFFHKGAYNINANSQNKIEKVVPKPKEENPDDIHNRQTTPIRPVNKAKYNSTIVQVGDQDSQYSSSGVRNQQNNIDLSNHEYVVEEYQTGSRYEGYKLNGERDGNGKFFYQDGGFYEGQWKNNKMDGWGKLYYEGGKLAYEGNWSQDEFHGFGKVYNDNPVSLECGFDFTNFDLLEDYWEYYEGMLVKDTKEGRGKIMLTNGELFEGDFHNDRIQGFGKFFMKEGNMIEGIWRDSKLIKIISS